MRIVKGRNGKCFPSFFKKARAVQNEKMLMSILPKYRPCPCPIPKTDNAMVELKLTYYFPHTSSTPKSKRDKFSFMTSRPDVDNISKAMIDCMTKCGYWEDDSQLSLVLRKMRGPSPCIKMEIAIYELSYKEE